MAGNQYIADPRQSAFLKGYLDPNSETFSNAYRSALAAGYSDEYAKTILSQDVDWLSENLKDEHLVHLAEKALQEALTYTTIDETGKVDSGVGRIKMDASKLVLKGLKKDKFSERSEVTGKNGEQINFVISSDIANKHGIKSQTETDSQK